jgi:hypothetical protein
VSPEADDVWNTRLEGINSTKRESIRSRKLTLVMIAQTHEGAMRKSIRDAEYDPVAPATIGCIAYGHGIEGLGVLAHWGKVGIQLGVYLSKMRTLDVELGIEVAARVPGIGILDRKD